MEFKLPITVDVTNVGERSGADVIQVYVSDLESSLQRPRKELKAFTKIFLEKGKTGTARVEIDRLALAFWSEEDEKWRAEAGTFKVIVSKSADPADELLEAQFELPKTLLWSGL